MEFIWANDDDIMIAVPAVPAGLKRFTGPVVPDLQRRGFCAGNTRDRHFASASG